MAKIGKNILENLTTGMYSDSKVAYREYVQNACDQIDKAIDSGIVAPELAEVAIFIDQKKRYISIEDNATGVREKDFVAQLGDIANSDKKIGVDKGFRGIGRLCGLAYCRTLVFTTSYAGEAVASQMSFDAKLMREMLISDKKYTVDEILDAIVTTKTDKEEKDKHYFKVELIDINHENTDLLDTAGVMLKALVLPLTNTRLLLMERSFLRNIKPVCMKVQIMHEKSMMMFLVWSLRTFTMGKL